jgi:cytochrome c
MDSFEFNKIAGAVLSALLVAFGSSTLIYEMKIGQAKTDKAGYTLDVKVASSDPGAAKEAPPAFDAARVVAQIAKADPAAGAGVYARCKSCHLVDKSGRSTPAGPNLWDIIGRNRASVATYTNYSSAMKGKEGTWTYESLANYLHNPRGYIPNNRMSFAGIKDEGQLASLIAYLRTLSDTPKPLPN